MSYREQDGQVILVKVPLSEIQGWAVSATKRKIEIVLRRHADAIADATAQEIAGYFRIPRRRKKAA